MELKETKRCDTMGQKEVIPTKKLLCLLLTALLLVTPVWGAEPSEQEKEAACLGVGTAALACCTDDSMTDLEKLTAIHDWICLHVEYGATTRATTVYGALVEGKAVCTGYASAYAYLASLAGLEGVSTYSADMDHAWILVTLNGERYFSDCTWDDGKKAKMGLIRHTYWLFDETNAWETGEHYGWDSRERVPGGELECAPWSIAMTRVVFSGQYAFYIDESFNLWRCDRTTWETECLLSMRESWPIWGVEKSRRSGLYSGLVLLDGRLYFNTPYAVCSVDKNGGNLIVELIPDTSEGVLYGLDVRDGELCCSLATEPDAVKYETLPTGISAVGAWGYIWDDPSGEPNP